MRRVLHLFDGTADWEQRIAVAQILDRSPADHQHVIASLDTRRPARGWFPDCRIHRAPSRFGLAAITVAKLQRILESHHIDIIHAWGWQAAFAANMARPARCVLVLTCFDPHVTTWVAKLCRVMGGGERLAVACASSTVRRRLVESGIALEKCVVVRPGVDFGWINHTKAHAVQIRSQLGIEPHEKLLLAFYPLVVDDSHDRVVWSGHLIHFLDNRNRLIVCGGGQDFTRLQQLSARMPFKRAVVWGDHTTRFEELIAVSDGLIITPYIEVSTTSIAWAMAASVPVIGSAVYSIAEIIAHKQNGRLIKPIRGSQMVVEITAAVRHFDEMRQEKEVARGQAFEVFSVRRFVDQNVHLYENLRQGRTPGSNIADPAMVG